MLPIVSLSAASGLEGDSVSFRVTLSEASLSNVTLQARTVTNGTATRSSHDADAGDRAFLLTIPAGSTVLDVNYSPSGVFGSNEFDENFTLELSNPTNAELAGGGPVLQATGVVLDDNGGPNLALFVSDPVVYETDAGGAQAVFEVRLSQASTSNITMD